MSGCQCHECYIRAGATPAERIARRREVASGQRDDKPGYAEFDKRVEALISPPINQPQSSGG